MTQIEQRNTMLQDVKVVNEEDAMVVEGYALQWDMPSHPIVTDAGAFTESFQQGAFDETLELDEQLILYGHEMNSVLGRTENKTAELVSDELGLRVSVTLPNTTLGKDTFELVKRGDLAGMSVGFIAEEDDFTYDSEGNIQRVITKARLVEVSLVPTPAYASSNISERTTDKLEEVVATKEEEKRMIKLKEEKRQRLILLTQL